MTALKPTPEEIAWAAGLFEGEGSVSISHRGGNYTSVVGAAYPVIVLQMTDEDVVERFHRIIGCGFVRSRDPGVGRKTIYRWQTKSNSEVATVIDALYEHMGARRRARMDEVRALLVAKTARRSEVAREVLTRDPAGRFV